MEAGNVWSDMGAAVRGFIARRVGNAHAAEDLTQDVMLKVQRGLAAAPAPDKLAAWVFEIARNTVIDYQRSPRSRPAVEAGQGAEPAAPDGEPDLTRELSSCLRPMIQKLPQPYREALELTEYEGLTQQEAAGRLGVSLSGVKSRVQRARDKLRAMLLDCCRVQLDVRGGVLDHQRTDRSDRYCADGGDPCGGSGDPCGGGGER